MNRPGLAKSERIPRGVHRIVSHVPFDSLKKKKTTEISASHWARMGRILPEQWIDLSSGE